MIKYSEALSYYELTLEIHQENSSKDSVLATVYYNIGMLHHDLKDRLTAYNYCSKAIEIMSKTLPSNHPSWINTWRDLNSILEKGSFWIDKDHNDLSRTANIETYVGFIKFILFFTYDVPKYHRTFIYICLFSIYLPDHFSNFLYNFHFLLFIVFRQTNLCW